MNLWSSVKVLCFMKPLPYNCVANLAVIDTPRLSQHIILLFLLWWVGACLLPWNYPNIVLLTKLHNSKSILFWCKGSSCSKQNVAHLQLQVHLHTSTNQIQQTNINSGIVLLGNFNDLDRHWISQSLDLKQVVRVPTMEKSTINLIFTDVGEFYHPPELKPRQEYPFFQYCGILRIQNQQLRKRLLYVGLSQQKEKEGFLDGA